MNTDFFKRLPGRALWHTPNPFRVAAMLASGYSLRCVLFHDVSDSPTTFTRGLGVTLSVRAFEKTLRFLVRHYTPVSLEDVLHTSELGTAARPPVLITFDDAYASVAENALPLCRQYGVPALFFVNARFVDNHELSLDNLICHVANIHGLARISAVASAVAGSPQDLRSIRQIFGDLVPSLSLTARREFYGELARAAGVNPCESAQQARLYVTTAQIAELAASNCEIGNHTYSHVHGRTLEARELVEEIDWNRSLLESMTAVRVRSFSVPYGSSADLPPSVARHLEQRGYEAVFLGERLMNTVAAVGPLYRVSIQQGTDADLFAELEVMPRLRALRDALFHTPAAASS